MPSQRTGGRGGMKIHLLIDKAPAPNVYAVCGRLLFDVAYTKEPARVTCRACRRRKSSAVVIDS